MNSIQDYAKRLRAAADMLDELHGTPKPQPTLRDEILDDLEYCGSLAGVVQYDYSEPDADGHCFARLNKLHTLRSDHNPSVRVEILSGTDPTEAVSLLASILKFVKKQAKQPGAFVVAAPVQTDNFDEVPF